MSNLKYKTVENFADEKLQYHVLVCVFVALIGMRQMVLE